MNSSNFERGFSTCALALLLDFLFLMFLYPYLTSLAVRNLPLLIVSLALTIASFDCKIGVRFFRCEVRHYFIYETMFILINAETRLKFKF